MIRYLLPALLLSSPAFATEDAARVLGPADTHVSVLTEEKLSPQERFDRTNEVLRHFGMEPDAATPNAFAGFQSAQTFAGANEILAIVDPTHQFSQWFDASEEGLRSYLDGGVKRRLYAGAEFAGSDEAIRSSGLVDRLRGIARGGTEDQPLRGLRVALDPGHMGTDLWDERTGKFITDAHGHKISEGLINLQTCLLVEKNLEALGAEVSITHRELAPVYDVPYEKLPLADFARDELRSEALSPWFQSLLASSPTPGPAFEKSPQVKKLFSEFERINYFMLRADLTARIDFINRVKPDVVLIVHYDTASGGGVVTPKAIDGTKTYVVGDFEPGEFATQKMRTQFARRLLDREGWSTSLLLNRLVAQSLKRELAIPYSKNGGGASFELEPGVFARNLGIPSALNGMAVSYIETLAYDVPEEFNSLREKKGTLEIGGVGYPYSGRLETAAGAISDGVLSFVKSFAN